MPRLNQTHCVRGHKFTVKNTMINRNGTRRCRMCHALYQRKYYHLKIKPSRLACEEVA